MHFTFHAALPLARRRPVVWLCCMLAALWLAGCATVAPATPTAEPPDVRAGAAAPAFALASTDGATVALSDYVGTQPVLLYFHMAVG